jgi:hypothetical protein
LIIRADDENRPSFQMFHMQEDDEYVRIDSHICFEVFISVFILTQGYFQLLHFCFRYETLVRNSESAPQRACLYW